MKKTDAFIIAGIIILLSPFFIFPQVFHAYETFNKEHGMVMAFIKFGILATFGEAVGLRIKTGVYNHKGFGLIPRAIVWGFLGLTIAAAFKIFATGVPVFLAYLGKANAPEAIKGVFSLTKLCTAFAISAAMNVTYAPVMMTFHKITDTHILSNGGRFACLFRPIKFADIFVSINWRVQWNFVFKKTIPFFWIPAHTITFLLPPEYQVLFAAALSVALGIFLAVASVLNQEKQK
ncbi:MAG: Mpv17/PMP22 family protein [Bacteroidota bacterium]